MPMQAQKKGEGISPTFSQPGPRYMVSTTLLPPYPREIPGTHCIGGCVGLGAHLDFTEEISSSGIRSPDRPGRRESLYRLSYPGRILHDHTTVKLYILLVSRLRLLPRSRCLPASDSKETFLSSLQFYQFPGPRISQRC
jgi:hypothetical protein